MTDNIRSVTNGASSYISTRYCLYPMCTCGTCSYSSMMLVIHHKSLRSILSPSNVYLRDPSASDLWDLMAYVSCVPVEPFSISIRPVGPDGPMGPDGLCVTCTYGTIRPLGPDGQWDLSPSPSDLWDPMSCVSLVAVGV